MNFHLKRVTCTRLADTDTPVSIYLRLRNHFAECLLLEHSEYPASPGFSYICCAPLASISLRGQNLRTIYPDGPGNVQVLSETDNLIELIENFRLSFSTDHADESGAVNGLFGYFNYDVADRLGHPGLSRQAENLRQIPDFRLTAYQYVIAYNHSRHELSIVHFYSSSKNHSGTQIIEDMLREKPGMDFPFQIMSEECADRDDRSYLEMVEKGRQHCIRGDVFQIVLSREFSTAFRGDDFRVYRALRSINPSPYLFYLDYGDYRLFGSSPEAQLKISAGKATLNPIAGTYRRTGNTADDAVIANTLLSDEKEQAEHVMLVDLARNDLSKSYRSVDVPVFKQIRTCSHVLHIVSEVTGEDPLDTAGPLQILADTFPAGTLSGAPKHRAMQLIDEIEHRSRGFYGGCAGFIGFDGNCNLAIMIRSFQSMNNTLYYRAGAGVVAASDARGELEEVNNKIAALRKAIHSANAS